MGRPRFYWYYIVKKMITESPNFKNPSIKEQEILEAMKSVEMEILELSNGTERMKAVNDILIRKTKTYAGVGIELHYDCRTVQNWITDYIFRVGKKANY